MSIALSFVLYSSKKLQILAILFSLFLVVTAIYIGRAGSLPISVRFLLGAACLLTCVSILFWLHAKSRKNWHISIDGQGVFRCRQIKNNARLPGRIDLVTAPTYYLTSGTILWSQLLILRLRRLEDDIMINLMVISDAVSADEFRRLAVACHWLVRNEKSGIN